MSDRWIKVLSMGPFLYGLPPDGLGPQWVVSLHQANLLIVGEREKLLTELTDPELELVNLMELAIDLVLKNLTNYKNGEIEDLLVVLRSLSIDSSDTHTDILRKANNSVIINDLWTKIFHHHTQKVLEGRFALVYALWMYFTQMNNKKNFVYDLNNRVRVERKQVEKSKKAGNDEFKNENYREAVRLYSKALKKCRLCELLYGNRAQAFLNLNKPQAALSDAKRAVVIKPTWTKGWYRLAQALIRLNKHEEAQKANQKALQWSDSESSSYKGVLESQKVQIQEAMDDQKAKAKQPRKKSHSDENGDLPDLVSSGESDSETVDVKRKTHRSGNNTPKATRPVTPLTPIIPPKTASPVPPKTAYPVPPKTAYPVPPKTASPVPIKVPYPSLTKPAPAPVPVKPKPTPVPPKPATAVLREKKNIGNVVNVESTYQPPIQVTEAMRKQRTEFRRLSKCGSEAYIEMRWPAAIEHYQNALDCIEGVGVKALSLDVHSHIILEYAFSMANIKINMVENINKGISHLNGILNSRPELSTVKFPIGYYGMGKGYVALCRYGEAIEPLTLCKRMLEHDHGTVAFSWPGTDTLIQNSRRKLLFTKTESLLLICKYPPRPYGVCQDHVDTADTHRNIYLKDPGFKGCVTMVCRAHCVIDYHPVCWKRYKQILCDNERLSDKDMLDTDCPTPDCGDIIYKIKTYNQNLKIHEDVSEKDIPKENKDCVPALKIPKSSMAKIEKKQAKKERRRKLRMDHYMEEQAKAENDWAKADLAAAAAPDSSTIEPDNRSEAVAVITKDGVYTDPQAYIGRLSKAPKQKRLSKGRSPLEWEVNFTDNKTDQLPGADASDTSESSQTVKKRRPKFSPMSPSELTMTEDDYYRDEWGYKRKKTIEHYYPQSSQSFANRLSQQLDEYNQALETKDNLAYATEELLPLRERLLPLYRSIPGCNSLTVRSRSFANRLSQQLDEYNQAFETDDNLGYAAGGATTAKKDTSTINDYLYTYFAEILEDNGPVLVDDPIMVDELENFPLEHKHMILKSGGLRNFLQASLRFNIVGNFVCLVRDTARAEEMMICKTTMKRKPRTSTGLDDFSLDGLYDKSQSQNTNSGNSGSKSYGHSPDDISGLDNIDVNDIDLNDIEGDVSDYNAESTDDDDDDYGDFYSFDEGDDGVVAKKVAVDASVSPVHELAEESVEVDNLTAAGNDHGKAIAPKTDTCNNGSLHIPNNLDVTKQNIAKSDELVKTDHSSESDGFVKGGGSNKSDAVKADVSDKSDAIKAGVSDKSDAVKAGVYEKSDAFKAGVSNRSDPLIKTDNLTANIDVDLHLNNHLSDDDNTNSNDLSFDSSVVSKSSANCEEKILNINLPVTGEDSISIATSTDSFSDISSANGTKISSKVLDSAPNLTPSTTSTITSNVTSSVTTVSSSTASTNTNIQNELAAEFQAQVNEKMQSVLSKPTPIPRSTGITIPKSTTNLDVGAKVFQQSNASNLSTDSTPNTADQASAYSWKQNTDMKTATTQHKSTVVSVKPFPKSQPTTNVLTNRPNSTTRPETIPTLITTTPRSNSASLPKSQPTTMYPTQFNAGSPIFIPPPSQPPPQQPIYYTPYTQQTVTVPYQQPVPYNYYNEYAAALEQNKVLNSVNQEQGKSIQKLNQEIAGLRRLSTDRDVAMTQSVNNYKELQVLHEDKKQKVENLTAKISDLEWTVSDLKAIRSDLTDQLCEAATEVDVLKDTVKKQLQVYEKLDSKFQVNLKEHKATLTKQQLRAQNAEVEVLKGRLEMGKQLLVMSQADAEKHISQINAVTSSLGSMSGIPEEMLTMLNKCTAHVKLCQTYIDQALHSFEAQIKLIESGTELCDLPTVAVQKPPALPVMPQIPPPMLPDIAPLPIIDPAILHSGSSQSSRSSSVERPITNTSQITQKPTDSVLSMLNVVAPNANINPTTNISKFAPTQTSSAANANMSKPPPLVDQSSIIKQISPKIVANVIPAAVVDKKVDAEKLATAQLYGPNAVIIQPIPAPSNPAKVNTNQNPGQTSQNVKSQRNTPTPPGVPTSAPESKPTTGSAINPPRPPNIFDEMMARYAYSMDEFRTLINEFKRSRGGHMKSVHKEDIIQFIETRRGNATAGAAAATAQPNIPKPHVTTQSGTSGIQNVPRSSPITTQNVQPKPQSLSNAQKTPGIPVSTPLEPKIQLQGASTLPKAPTKPQTVPVKGASALPKAPTNPQGVSALPNVPTNPQSVAICKPTTKPSATNGTDSTAAAGVNTRKTQRVGPMKTGDVAEKPKNTFDQLINVLSIMFPDYSKSQFRKRLAEVRSDYGGTFNDLTQTDIINRVTDKILFANKPDTKPVPKPTPKPPTPPPRVTSPSSSVSECSICMEPVNGQKDFSELRCQHVFHDHCLRKWLRVNSTCPICRDHALLADEFPPLK